MAVNAAQFIHTTKFHQQNLDKLLKQNIDLPEAPGILACMIYLQQSINAASDLLPTPTPKDHTDGKKASPDPA